MIELRNLSVNQGQFQLSGLNLEIHPHEYAVLMGKTGSGKTTLLELVAGLRQPNWGQIVIDGEDVTRWKPAARNLGYAPQEGVLFPKMKVYDNLSYGLSLRKIKGQRAKALLDPLIELLGISHLLERYPARLSGGEKQRVALGRALAYQPKVLLLDEPLSALDEDTHDQMLQLLSSIHQHRQVTVLHVTHRLQEAEVLADRLIRIEKGELIQSVRRRDAEGDTIPLNSVNSYDSPPIPPQELQDESQFFRTTG